MVCAGVALARNTFFFVLVSSTAVVAEGENKEEPGGHVETGEE